jgi:hypothetical protein
MVTNPTARRRCPHCGGPAIDDRESEFEVKPACTCINCGYRFSPRPWQAANRRVEVHLPVWLLIFGGFLAAGLASGIILVVLSGATALGGWLLLALGAGLVVIMGAFEAGRLDGPVRQLRKYIR